MSRRPVRPHRSVPRSTAGPEERSPAPLRDRLWHGAAPKPVPRSEGRCRPVPHAPFTQVVDGRLGIVRPHGLLTADTGALLRETVQALHRSGHTRVCLDLTGLHDADDAGLDMLCALRRSGTVRGRSLVLLAPEQQLSP
ncbi:STAS domain-containing protein [Blastococcus tunisiensis]|uniref:STAS domain-containing protein n=1 Tax=Blastococcus tunisiensis TaxID=1798228 RepID=A0A1I2J286_9ACTN|nr:STAS domain-containing protein [Blastococcus sp. DSM 46838]SFF47377.1 STAS domain-containing protein [Blastococcus sp. DSM 46838]